MPSLARPLIAAGALLSVVSWSFATPLLSAQESLDRIVRVVERPATTSEMKSRDYEQALTMLDRFERDYGSAPELATAAFLRGGCYVGLGRGDEAHAKLGEALSGPLTARYVPTAHYLRGRLLLERGDAEEGIRELESAIEANAEDDVVPHVRLTLAGALTEHGDPDRARQVVATLIQTGGPVWLMQAARALDDNLRRIGMPAPAFAAATIDGDPVSLVGLRGKVVLLDFWASWCPPCIASLPGLRRAYARFHRRGFEVVGLSLDRSRGALDSYLRANDLPWVHIYSGARAIAEQYGDTGIPKTFLVDRDGAVVAVDLHGDSLEETIARVLSGS